MSAERHAGIVASAAHTKAKAIYVGSTLLTAAGGEEAAVYGGNI